MHGNDLWVVCRHLSPTHSMHGSQTNASSSFQSCTSKPCTYVRIWTIPPWALFAHETVTHINIRACNFFILRSSDCFCTEWSYCYKIAISIGAYCTREGTWNQDHGSVMCTSLEVDQTSHVTMGTAARSTGKVCYPQCWLKHDVMVAHHECTESWHTLATPHSMVYTHPKQSSNCHLKLPKYIPSLPPQQFHARVQ